mmetsp:Transcript_6879/g.20968  ORF Transcript_6879/g.20968 Transcript_6879/m.20968 type:complete len:622 (-) Transcript_6879:295-2160(-)
MASFEANGGAKKVVYVLDCGGQYCHLIASRIRQHAALSKVVPCDVPAESIRGTAGAVIVSGGPESVFDPAARRVDPKVWDLEVPILGICYGCQLLCHDLGGEVEESRVGEFGEASLRVASSRALLPAEADGSRVWMSHRDRVVSLPPGFETFGFTEHSPHACVAHRDKPIFGLQWHPEVQHSVPGFATLGRFVDLAGLRGSWNCEDFADAEIARLRRVVSAKSVFVLVSGGVDSTVAYALCAKALPADRVAGLYVDTGMMRKDETRLVKESLEKAGLGGRLEYVDASERFLEALEGLVEPEAKRRAIGKTFLEVQRTECARLFAGTSAEWLLGQGTIYPDTIESGGDSGQRADVIKTHHNRVPEIDKLLAEGRVVEPLAALYKDEVRAVGERLGLPHALVWRHPFPGPGLGVRLLCTRGGESRPLLRDSDLALLPPGVCAEIPPLRSVGCQGDSRTYRNFVVFSGDYPRDWHVLGALATSLINQSDTVNRATISLTRRSPSNAQFFDVTADPPHTVTRPRLDRLRDADAAVAAVLADANLMASIWQCPVAMAPLASTDRPRAETVVLRPVDSTEAMTASFSKLPWPVVDRLADAVKSALGDSCADVLYDITNKPPGTIEWE